MFDIYDHTYDAVINSHYITASISYNDAVDNLVPAIDRFDEQREKQNQKFYFRLANDIQLGCVMPPITIALIDDQISLDRDVEKSVIDHKIQNSVEDYFVLDGIQRLNTLARVKKECPEEFFCVRDNKLYLNILICSSYDLLLYRMITLNNGQRPMTARHQIEIIAGNIFDFEDLAIDIQAEKRRPNTRRKRGAFKKADVIKGYLAFLSSSVNIDNSKIIESKMDEILARKVVESDIVNSDVGFDDVVSLVADFADESEDLKFWFQQQNNFIGFCSGAREGYKDISLLRATEFNDAVKVFEDAFVGMDVSRIKVGMARRKSVEYFISNFSHTKELDELDLTYELSAVI